MKYYILIPLVVLVLTGCVQKQTAQKKVLTECPEQWVTNQGVGGKDQPRELFKIHGKFVPVDDFSNGIEWVKANCATEHIGLD